MHVFERNRIGFTHSSFNSISLLHFDGIHAWISTILNTNGFGHLNYRISYIKIHHHHRHHINNNIGCIMKKNQWFTSLFKLKCAPKYLFIACIVHKYNLFPFELNGVFRKRKKKVSLVGFPFHFNWCRQISKIERWFSRASRLFTFFP